MTGRQNRSEQSPEMTVQVEQRASPVATYLERLNGYQDFAQQMMQEWQIPGVAIAVVTDKEVLLSQGFGTRDLHRDLEVTPQTLFAIASCTKAFTAMTLAMLVDEGKLSWDTPVRHYLPSFRLADPLASERVTPRDLLTHRSGLPDHTWAWYNSLISREEMVERLQYLEPTSDFRATWQYNNMMYAAAGYLLEVLTGQSWENFIRKRILKPLGMTSTTFSTPGMLHGFDVASPHQLVKGELQTVDYYVEAPVIAPAGGMYSNLLDLTQWLQCLLRQGHYGQGGKYLVSQAQFQQLIAPQMVMPALDFPTRPYPELSHPYYTLGWWVLSYRGHSLVQHSGGIDGFSSLLTFLPDDHLGIIVLTNRKADLVPVHGVFTRTIVDRLLGLSEISWNERTRQEYRRQRQETEPRRQQWMQECIPDAPLSHPLNEYTGQFVHPAYGCFSIEQDGQGIKGRLNDLEYTFTHLHYDSFLVELIRYDYLTRATFITDLRGTIASFAIALSEPEAKPIIFQRRSVAPDPGEVPRA